jgi:hypothetical protein
MAALNFHFVLNAAIAASVVISPIGMLLGSRRKPGHADLVSQPPTPKVAHSGY